MKALGCFFCPSNITLRSKQTDEDKKVDAWQGGEGRGDVLV